MRTRAAAVALSAAALGAAAALPRGATAQDWLEMSTARQADAIQSVRLRVEYGAGILTVKPAREGDLYDAHFRYDASRFEPVRSFERSGNTADVRLGVRSRNGQDGVHLDWSDLASGDVDLDDAEKSGSLEVGLSRTVPTDLRIAVGAARSRLSLGGIPVTNLVLETGASETRLDFSEPNPAAMDELRIKAGAASLKAEDLGNAGFKKIRVEGGVGDVSLDFSGKWSSDARGSIHVGLGSLTLRFPRDLGVELDKSTVLASFTAAGFVKTDGGYRTRNWDSAAHHLELEVNAAFGSIDVEVAP
ncbi:MAG TPA: hypothetical protein VKA44_00165 [Gemmatimonadota bacterium]|nr:hypothetical protein [Gemmatimonadota bacterium]